MHASHDHAHHPAPAKSVGISLLRLSARARIGIASVFAAAIWLIVYLVAR